MVDNNVIDFLVNETNRYANAKLAVQGLPRFARVKKWVNTTREKMKKFLSAVMFMGN